MKNKIVLGILSFVLAVGVFGLAAPKAEAVRFKKFKKDYQGTWVNEYNCGAIGGTGTITIQLSGIDIIRKSSVRARIKKARIYFSDGTYGGMKATGKFYQKNGKNKIRLNYGAEESSNDYLIGRITENTLKGKYYHEYLDQSCQWGGSFDLEQY